MVCTCYDRNWHFKQSLDMPTSNPIDAHTVQPSLNSKYMLYTPSSNKENSISSRSLSQYTDCALITMINSEDEKAKRTVRLLR